MGPCFRRDDKRETRPRDLAARPRGRRRSETPRTVRCRPCESRDPYAGASRFSTVADSFCSKKRLWLWVPAFAGTTNVRHASAILRRVRGDEGGVRRREPFVVVPAKAGTHTPGPRGLARWLTAFAPETRLWLWVPAFAGTTN